MTTTDAMANDEGLLGQEFEDGSHSSEVLGLRDTAVGWTDLDGEC